MGAAARFNARAARRVPPQWPGRPGGRSLGPPPDRRTERTPGGPDSDGRGRMPGIRVRPRAPGGAGPRRPGPGDPGPRWQGPPGRRAPLPLPSHPRQAPAAILAHKKGVVWHDPALVAESRLERLGTPIQVEWQRSGGAPVIIKLAVARNVSARLIIPDDTSMEFDSVRFEHTFTGFAGASSCHPVSSPPRARWLPRRCSSERLCYARGTFNRNAAMAARCALHGTCCKLHTACLHVAWFMRTLHGAPCKVHGAPCTVHGAYTRTRTRRQRPHICRGLESPIYSP